MKNKYYIGLASTFHDPSIAIIDQNGDILFAESTERYLQNKRAMGSPADTEVWIEKLIKEYCDDPFNAEFHIACTWSNNYLRLLKLYCSLGFLNFAPSKFTKKILDGAYKSMLPGENFVWFLNKQLASNIQTGANLERVLRWNFNNDNIKCHRFNHHITHAAYAAYSSHFSDATCLVVDGIGEKGSISYFKYENDIFDKFLPCPCYFSV
ncbi:MAG: hypothetical protein LBE13_09450 [Bacteroidales bacterium]|jgi:carbamoyltransferase|nr:hypothetical protein [Bacteroidales bacterium]